MIVSAVNVRSKCKSSVLEDRKRQLGEKIILLRLGIEFIPPEIR